ncbi:MAG: hypothetical protein AAF191_10970 [Verrucomicrobiota bacterium]
MKTSLAVLLLGSLLGSTVTLLAQAPRPTDLGQADLDLGEAGIAWYTTWETGVKEATRTNRPIFFVAAATQCGGIPGVF